MLCALSCVQMTASCELGGMPQATRARAAARTRAAGDDCGTDGNTTGWVWGLPLDAVPLDDPRQRLDVGGKGAAAGGGSTRAPERSRAWRYQPLRA